MSDGSDHIRYARYFGLRQTVLFAGLTATALAAAATACVTAQARDLEAPILDMTGTPPVAERRTASVKHHGVTLTDDYGWLRAANWQDVVKDPAKLPADIRAYLEAENAFTEQAIAPTAALRERLYAEMRGRMKEDDATVPAPSGSFEYGIRYATGGEYPLVVRVPRGGGPEQVLLDGNAMGKGLDYFAFGNAVQSPDHKLMAYDVDSNGSEVYTLRVRDLATGADLPDVIPSSASGTGIAWAPDSKNFYYGRLDEELRSQELYRHRIGTSPSADELVYREADNSFAPYIDEMQSTRFVAIVALDAETNEVHLVDTNKPEAPPMLVAKREAGHQYYVLHAAGQGGDRLIILTNSGGAEDFRIVEGPIKPEARSEWREIVPHRPGRLIQGIAVYRNHLVRLEVEAGLERIVIRRLSDGDEHAIAFDEEAYSLGLSGGHGKDWIHAKGGYEFDTTRIRFTYSSMTTPPSVYDYDMETRVRTLRKTEAVPSGHDPAKYVTRRVMAPAPDGELVPVSLLHAKATPIDGTAPLLLYGYGSYGSSSNAGFSTDPLSLVDRGFVYAIAHVRGGKEKGYAWYRNGKLAKKTNTFDDFSAVAEFLVRDKWAAPDRVVAYGRSAGGMLMGAVANRRPELFRGIIAEVPFVDVLNTILDDSLPLTPPEWNEWGNPIKSAEDFARIRAYSPYDQVKPQAYPAMLMLGGLTDPRVTYWEPAKWTAKLRALNTGTNPLLLKINMGAGHSGASGRFAALPQVALTYAFALAVTAPK